MDDVAPRTGGDRWTRVADAVALTRPTLMIPLWTLHILGAAHAASSDGRWRTWWVPPVELIWYAVAQTLVMAAVHIVNQLADAESDAANRKLFLIGDGILSSRFAIGEATALTVAGLCLSAWRSIQGGSATLFALVVASAAMGFAYSLPPLRLKARAGWDWLANSVGYGVVAFGVGWASSGISLRSMWLVGLPYAWSVGATFALTTIPDIPGDARAGDRTFGVALGPVKTAIAGCICLLVGCASSIGVRNYVALWAIVPSMFLFGRTTIRLFAGGSDPSLTRTTQAVILVLSVIASVAVPVYAVALAGLVIGTRAYYRRRFGLVYP